MWTFKGHLLAGGDRPSPHIWAGEWSPVTAGAGELHSHPRQATRQERVEGRPGERAEEEALNTVVTYPSLRLLHSQSNKNQDRKFKKKGHPHPDILNPSCHDMVVTSSPGPRLQSVASRTHSRAPGSRLLQSPPTRRAEGPAWLRSRVQIGTEQPEPGKCRGGRSRQRQVGRRAAQGRQRGEAQLPPHQTAGSRLSSTPSWLCGLGSVSQPP